MPIRAELRPLYPPNWAELSRRVRFERARGECEGCRRPRWCANRRKSAPHFAHRMTQRTAGTRLVRWGRERTALEAHALQIQRESPAQIPESKIPGDELAGI